MPRRSRSRLFYPDFKRSKIHCADCNLTLSDLGESSSDDDNLSSTISNIINSLSPEENLEPKDSSTEEECTTDEEESPLFVTEENQSLFEETKSEHTNHSPEKSAPVEALETCEESTLSNTLNSEFLDTLTLQSSVTECQIENNNNVLDVEILNSRKQLYELTNYLGLVELKKPVLKLERIPKDLFDALVSNSTCESIDNGLGNNIENNIPSNVEQLELNTECSEPEDTVDEYELKTPVIKLERLSPASIKKCESFAISTPVRTFKSQQNKKRFSLKEKMNSIVGEDFFDPIDDSYFSCKNGVEEINIDKLNERINEFIRKAYRVNKKAKYQGDIDWELPAIPSKSGTKRKVNDVAKGMLTEEEIEYLTEKLETFMTMNNLDYDTLRIVSSNNPFQIRVTNGLRLKFIQYLSKDLANRTPRTVLSFITRLGVRKGRFTPNEDKFLIEMHNNYTGPNFHSLCGLILNRYRFNIYRRILRLKQQNLLGPKPEKKTYTNAEIRAGILNSILNRVGKRDLTTLLATFSCNMWIGIGNENHISPSLAKAIYLCEIYPTMLATGHPIYYYKLCSKLIDRLYSEKYSSWEDIKWKKLRKQINNLPRTYLYLLFRKLIKTYVPPKKWSNYKENINYLHKKVLPIFINKTPEEDFIMKRVVLQE